MFITSLFLLGAAMPALAQNWVDLPGVATQISARGTELWVINAGQEIYRWTGTYWERKAGAAVKVGASPDGWSWVVNAGHGIFRWNINTGAWEQIPGGLSQISALSRDIAMGCNPGGDVFVWKDNKWTHIGREAKWTSIGEEEEKWMVLRDGTVWRWIKDHFEKQPCPVHAETIDVQSPNRIIITDNQQRIFVLRGERWQQLNGFASSATITDSKLYAIVPTRIKHAAFMSCQDTFIIKPDTSFRKCSIARKTIKGVNSEQCCDICRNVNAGGGCFFVPNSDDDSKSECNVCHGQVHGEEDVDGATYYIPK